MGKINALLPKFRQAQIEVLDLFEIMVTKYGGYNPGGFGYTLLFRPNPHNKYIDSDLFNKFYVFNKILKSIPDVPELYKDVVNQEKMNHFFDENTYNAILNSSRPILINEKDDVYFVKILNEIKKALHGNNSNWLIKAVDGETRTIDLSAEVINALKRVKDAIIYLINNSDLRYLLYSGLQHSDLNARIKFIADCESDELIVKKYKCCLIVNKIRNILLKETEILERFLDDNKHLLYKQFKRCAK